MKIPFLGLLALLFQMAVADDLAAKNDPIILAPREGMVPSGPIEQNAPLSIGRVLLDHSIGGSISPVVGNNPLSLFG